VRGRKPFTSFDRIERCQTFSELRQIRRSPSIGGRAGGLQDQRADWNTVWGMLGKWGHTEQVSLRVIITFILGFALAFAAGWYLGASLPHSG
jgi:hypothetical protein